MMSQSPAARTPKIPLPMEAIADFCRRWGVREFALFGSVLRDDFGPQSDVDVLVTLAPGVRRGLFDWEEMEEELRWIFGRGVDLLRHDGVVHSTNPDRRRAILDSAEVVHVEQ